MLSEFIRYLTEQIGQPYFWGGQHTKLTPETYKDIIHKREDGRGGYPNGESYADAAIAFCEKKFKAGADVLYAYDCSGLGMYWLYNLAHIYSGDATADMMMSRCADVKQTDSPRKGWWVFVVNSKGRATHIGYMVSDTELIEAKGRRYGVVKTKFKKSAWTQWGIPKVFYDEIVTPQPQPEPPTPPTPSVTKQMVYVIGKSVNVRDSDSKRGKVMFVAHKGNKFNLIDVSEDTGWYHIETHKGPSYISSRADLTCLITVS